MTASDPKRTFAYRHVVTLQPRGELAQKGFFAQTAAQFVEFAA